MTHHPARPRYLTAALLSFALAIALLLAMLSTSAHAWGATPGLNRYNSAVAALGAKSCRPIFATWGSSLFGCPSGAMWRLRLVEATDTFTMWRVR